MTTPQVTLRLISFHVDMSGDYLNILRLSNSQRKRRALHSGSFELGIFVIIAFRHMDLLDSFKQFFLKTKKNILESYGQINTGISLSNFYPCSIINVFDSY